jgi:hypothetical protein
MFTDVLLEEDEPPPPSIRLPVGQVANAQNWPWLGTIVVTVCTEYPVFLFAHTAYTANVVPAPLALFTSPIQPAVPAGNDPLMFAWREREEMTTPPPQMTVPAGQSTVPRVLVPWGADRPPELTTTYFFGAPFGTTTFGPGTFLGPGLVGCPTPGDVAYATPPTISPLITSVTAMALATDLTRIPSSLRRRGLASTVRVKRWTGQ